MSGRTQVDVIDTSKISLVQDELRSRSRFKRKRKIQFSYIRTILIFYFSSVLLNVSRHHAFELLQKKTVVSSKRKISHMCIHGHDRAAVRSTTGTMICHGPGGEGSLNDENNDTQFAFCTFCIFGLRSLLALVIFVQARCCLLYELFQHHLLSVSFASNIGSTDCVLESGSLQALQFPSQNDCFMLDCNAVW